ncbi:hypothetical protein HK100_006417, partial [Physocladia obscura]
ILNPTKPVPATVSSAAILSLEVLIDEQPVLKGTVDEAHGTDLSGTVSLALQSELDASRIQVQFYGAAMEQSPTAHSSSSNLPAAATAAETPEIVYTNSRAIWNASPTNPVLIPGAHDIRFMFKLPGNLPATESGRVQYILRVVIEGSNEKEIASLVEAVRVRRVVGTEFHLESLPLYSVDGVPGEPAGLPPSYGPEDGNFKGVHEIHDLPPDYDLKGKGKVV